MINYLANFIANILYRKSLRLQKILGFGLTLNNLPSEWINGMVLADMTSTWRRAGIRARGLNYFTVGAVKDGVSGRYDPESPLYQAWFGGYIVVFDKERSWTPEEHVLLGVADQEKWLRYYGDPNPVMNFNTDNQGEPITIGEYNTQLYYWSGNTHSDVGDKSNWLLSPTMQAMAHMMNKSNPSLNIKGSNFVPKWSAALNIEPYETFRGQGYVAIIDVAPRTKAVLYAGGIVNSDEQRLELKNLILKNIQIITM